MAGLRDEELAYLRVQATQGELYEGLYDTRKEHRGVYQVQLLNPRYGEEDPVARRFSLLEVD